MKPTRNGSVRSGAPAAVETALPSHHPDHSSHNEHGGPAGPSTIDTGNDSQDRRGQRRQNGANRHPPNQSNGPFVERLTPIDMPRRKGTSRSRTRSQPQAESDLNSARSQALDQRSRSRDLGEPHFDPRRSDGGLLRKRKAHDVVTSVCMFWLMPTALVILLVYLVMLCKYYACVRSALTLGARLVETLVWSGPVRMFSDMAGIPVALGIAVSIYYLVIFYFNSDVPGIRPPLPQVSWKAGVRADPNYSFGLLLGLVCLIVYSVPEILQFHSTRIYSGD